MQSNRTLVIIVLAVVLMLLVMGSAILISVAGIADREKYSINTVWDVPAATALSVNVTDTTGDKQRDIFVQDGDGIKLLTDQGQPLFEKPLPQPIASTQDDLDADGVPDIVVYSQNGATSQVSAFNGQGQTLWEVSLPSTGEPSRAATVDFDKDRRSEVIIGSLDGHLVALSAQGETLWQYDLPGGTALRGLYGVSTSESEVVVAGDEGGLVVVLNKQGQELWQTTAPGGLRRLRSMTLGGPERGYAMVGSVSGELTAYRGDSGQAEWTANLGQAVNEIRPAEIDGDPATTEVIAGGKDGGLWAFSQTGQSLWSGRVSDKVNEIAALDTDESGRDEIIVGDDTGAVTIFDASGTRIASFNGEGSIGRVEAARLAGAAGFLVADSNGVSLHTLTKTTAPFWYTPILTGLLACGVIAGVAYVLSSLKPAPTLRVSADQMTVEAQRARRRMLHESITDLKKIQQRGEVAGQAYLARMKELRGQLAEVNAALITLGEPIRVESFKCPHCGGSLELGTDRCEYCGHVVIV